MALGECAHGDEPTEGDHLCELCGSEDWGCTNALGYRHLCGTCFQIASDTSYELYPDSQGVPPGDPDFERARRAAERRRKLRPD